MPKCVSEDARAPAQQSRCRCGPSTGLVEAPTLRATEQRKAWLALALLLLQAGATVGAAGAISGSSGGRVFVEPVDVALELFTGGADGSPGGDGVSARRAAGVAGVTRFRIGGGRRNQVPSLSATGAQRSKPQAWQREAGPPFLSFSPLVNGTYLLRGIDHGLSSVSLIISGVNKFKLFVDYRIMTHSVGAGKDNECTSQHKSLPVAITYSCRSR